MSPYEALETMDRELLKNLKLENESLRCDTDNAYGLTLFYATFDGTL